MQYAKSLVSLCRVYSCAAEFEPGCDICISCGRDVALWVEHLVQHAVNAKFSSLLQHGIFSQSLIDVRLYNAILRSLEQTHCACMWFYMND